MANAFEDADFYDVHDDAEDLFHSTPEEALDAWWRDGNEPTGVTVYAFTRKVVDEAWLKRISRMLSEQAEERWREEYGDPDGDFSFDADALEAAFLPPLTATVNSAAVWACERVAQRTYTAAEVQAIVAPAQQSTKATP